MNPLLIESFQDELQKIATQQFVDRFADDKAPRIRGRRKRRLLQERVTAESLPKVVRERFRRAPRFAEDYARTAEEMAEQLRRAGADPSTVPVEVRPGMAATVRELGLDRKRRRRRKGEPRLNRNVGGVPVFFNPDSSAAARDRVNAAIFDQNRRTGTFDSSVRVSRRSPITLAHELGHVADTVEASKAFGGKFPENLLGGIIGEEVSATKRALRTSYAKKDPVYRALMLAATGTYMEKDIDPLDLRRTSDSPGYFAELASRRAALRGPDPTYRKALSRSKKYRDLYRSLRSREDALFSERGNLLEQRRRALAAIEKSVRDAENRGEDPGRLVKKYQDAEASWNKRLTEFANTKGKELARITEAKKRAYAGGRRNRRQYMFANPFIEPLYDLMTEQEKKYIDANIKAYRKNIAQQFGPEEANLYVREVRKALQSPTGRGLKTFLRRF